jgi:hypothetical protein
MDWLLEGQTIRAFLGDAIESDVAQFMLAFTIAAFIHSSRVKKEIRANFDRLADAIKDLSSALRQDLASHSDRIAKVEERMTKIEVIHKQ